MTAISSTDYQHIPWNSSDDDHDDHDHDYDDDDSDTSGDEDADQNEALMEDHHHQHQYHNGPPWGHNPRPPISPPKASSSTPQTRVCRICTDSKRYPLQHL